MAAIYSNGVTAGIFLASNLLRDALSSVYKISMDTSDSKLFVPRPLTESLKKRFTYKGPVLWNSLPVEAMN
jgi:hypothetical protein